MNPVVAHGRLLVRNGQEAACFALQEVPRAERDLNLAVDSRIGMQPQPAESNDPDVA